MKKLNLYVALALVTASLFTSCSKDDSDQELENETVNNIAENSFDNIAFDAPFFPLPTEVKSAIEGMKLEPSNFDYLELGFPNSQESEFIVIEDMLMAKSDFLTLSASGETKQYSTDFLVNTDIFQNIDIYAFTGVGDQDFEGLTPASLDALERAVENWNYTGSNIHFTITASDIFSVPEGTEILISATSLINSTGQAAFPTSDGAPGTFTFIRPEVNNVAEFFPEALEHLFTHELGHTIGLRHTDWDTRRSCVDLGLEPNQSREFFANRIFGTPPSFVPQPDSVMNACFNANEVSGEANLADQYAVFLLYSDY